jgi:hypothetical protein
MQKRLTTDVRDIVSRVSSLGSRVRVSRVFDLLDSQLAKKHSLAAHPFVSMQNLHRELRKLLRTKGERSSDGTVKLHARAVLIHPQATDDFRPVYVVVFAKGLQFCTVGSSPGVLPRPPPFEHSVCGYSAYVVEEI